MNYYIVHTVYEYYILWYKFRALKIGYVQI